MLLQTLRRRMTVWLRRPLGCAAACLLLLVVVVTATPRWETHSHAAPDSPVLTHAAAHGLISAALEQHSPDPQHPGENQQHTHAVGSSFSGAFEAAKLVLRPMATAMPLATPMVAPAINSRRTPPHRPPIA